MLRMDNRIAINSMLGSSNGGTNSRYFTTLDGTADWFTVPTITLTSSFILEAQLSTTSALAQYVLGNNTDDNGYVRVNATTGVIAVNFNSTKTIVGTVDVTDGKLHTVKVVNTLGSVELFIDGVSDGTVTGLVGNNTFDRIGDNHTASTSFNGVISDVKITDGTDLIRYYKIDEDLSATSTIIDSGSDGSNGTAVSITSSELFTLEGADWIGAELVVNGDFSNGSSNWTGVGSVVSEKYEVDYNSTFAALLKQTPNVLTLNLIYRLKFDAIVDRNTCTLFVGNTNTATINSTQNYNEIVSPTVSDGRLQFGGSDFKGSFDNFSAKRILQAP